jgi:hypothetical protein
VLVIFCSYTSRLIWPFVYGPFYDVKRWWEIF